MTPKEEILDGYITDCECEINATQSVIAEFKGRGASEPFREQVANLSTRLMVLISKLANLKQEKAFLLKANERAIRVWGLGK